MPSTGSREPIGSCLPPSISTRRRTTPMRGWPRIATGFPDRRALPDRRDDATPRKASGSMTSLPGPVAELRGVTRRYPGVVALDAVDFMVKPGEVRAILGKNGAGKSTLIRLLTGAETPDGGEVHLDGEPFRESGHKRVHEA